jgi:hypothetical protein
MTEETKKLFDAPWADASYVVEDMSYFDINDAHGQCMCSVHTQYFTSEKKPGIDEDAAEQTMNRILRLPELYDKLMWSVVQKCPDAFLTLDECRLCTDKKCEYREIVELLRKVRDGK